MMLGFRLARGYLLVAAVAGGLAAALTGCAVNTPELSSAPVATGSLSAAAPSTDAAAARPATPAAGKAKVALLVPLGGQGQLAVIGKAMKQAGEMALLERSSPQFELIVKDDLGTPEGARKAAEEALAEGAEIILGPLLAQSVEAVMPLAQARRVPVIAFSNDRRLARADVFLLSFMPDQDVERIVGYAASQGRRSYSALLPDDAYGRLVEEAFARAVAAAQGHVVAVERYGRGGTGMLEATRRLGEAMTNSADGYTPPADALLVPGEPDTLASLGPLIAYARIDPTRIKLLGTGGWDSPNIGRDATFVGAWYPAPDQRGWSSFSERFSKTFGTAPPRVATLAFDAVGIAMSLSGGMQEGRFSTAAITRQTGFGGADGIVRFQADGIAVRTLAVHEVQSFGSRVIDGQPGSKPDGQPTAQQRTQPGVQAGALDGQPASGRSVPQAAASRPEQLN